MASLILQLRPRIDAVLRGERVKFERHHTQDGLDLHLLVDYVPDCGEDGAVEGFYILVLDITARKQAELEQARSEERVRSILTHAPDAFISFDADGRIQEWNRQAEQTFGWRRDEALGRVVADSSSRRRCAKRTRPTCSTSGPRGRPAWSTSACNCRRCTATAARSPSSSRSPRARRAAPSSPTPSCTTSRPARRPRRASGPARSCCATSPTTCRR